MGWWSATILGGDSPLDTLGDIGRIIGNDYDYDDDSKSIFGGHGFTRENVEGNLSRIVEEFEKQLKKHVEKYPDLEENQSIEYQVLGAICLHVGAKIPAKLKKRMVLAAEQDEWLNEEGHGSERWTYIKDFIDKVKAHKPGQKTELAYEGLFDKFAKMANA